MSKTESQKPDSSIQDFEPTPVMRKEGSVELEDNRPSKSALLCIDLQYLGAKEGYGIFEEHADSGVSEQAIEYYLDRVWHEVVPNVAKLQKRFREQELEVIHARIQSLTADGRDRSAEHKRLGLHAAPGSKLAEFLPDVAPEDNEIVFNKTASGLFASTNIHYVLGNLGVTDLYIVGVYTNECVSSAVRSAADLGYRVTLISDGTAAITPSLQKSTILTVKERYAKVRQTQEVLEALDNLDS
ncbi:Peroxyureidoacrylate/ureidoacrylate amidohydrolase [Saliniradius amylolyticus]|uniref:Peroxyureidoacrylate/ureidoacrylate amidohydrolase n=1 Tax=Saliniradius amylolyticus TaxID=2183582 RepID=A0A2S2E3C9_9ALTE|nr:isochorismatase family cysteine hydrolase [Saliniradius amylolyticus]AWL12155.1 Peroxyureidoacrylate/ureidoacrylate amidohydrolase [Saliniradius amylolyticus]